MKAYIIFTVLFLASLIESVRSYHSTERYINEDVDNALAITLSELPGIRLDVDTIQCYRKHITIEQIRDTAFIAVGTTNYRGRQQTQLMANAGCNMATIFGLSNQRNAGFLMAAAWIWLLSGLWLARRKRVETVEIVESDMESYGGVCYDTARDKFSTTNGQEIKLTPMQHQLLKMFFKAEEHTLSKQVICDQLWPNKPDASDTLYTLIKRIKPIIEPVSSLRIESDRSRSYILTDK